MPERLLDQLDSTTLGVILRAGQVGPRARATEVGHTASTQADLGARLGARLDLDLFVPVRGRHGHPRSESGVRHGDAQIVVQLRALAAECRMGLHMDGDVEVAHRPAARPRLTFTGEADLVPIVDARRDRHTEMLAARPAALALAIRAGLADDLPLAATLRAARHVDHLAEHGGAGDADLTPAAALRAGGGARARPSPAAAARRAAVEGLEYELLLRAPDGLGERDGQVVAEVRSGRRARTARRRTGGTAEERVEQVAEGPEPREWAVILARLPKAAPAEEVVGAPALRVGEDLVRLVDLLEAMIRPG